MAGHLRYTPFMDLEERRWDKKNALHPLKYPEDPNAIIKQRESKRQEKRKELGELKAQMERSQLKAKIGKDKKEGIGGRKKEDVLSADAKTNFDRLQKLQQTIKKAEQEKGQTEQGRKSV